MHIPNNRCVHTLLSCLYKLCKHAQTRMHSYTQLPLIDQLQICTYIMAHSMCGKQIWHTLCFQTLHVPHIICALTCSFSRQIHMARLNVRVHVRGSVCVFVFVCVCVCVCLCKKNTYCLTHSGKKSFIHKTWSFICGAGRTRMHAHFSARVHAMPVRRQYTVRCAHAALFTPQSGNLISTKKNQSDHKFFFMQENAHTRSYMHICTVLPRVLPRSFHIWNACVLQQ
jgi:hypothetical protein